VGVKKQLILKMTQHTEERNTHELTQASAHLARLAVLNNTSTTLHSRSGLFAPATAQHIVRCLILLEANPDLLTQYATAVLTILQPVHPYTRTICGCFTPRLPLRASHYFPNNVNP